MSDCELTDPFSLIDDELLLLIFAFVAEDFVGPGCHAALSQAPRCFGWFRRSVPCICKRWFNLLCKPGPLWRTVHVHVEKEIALEHRAKSHHGSTTNSHAQGSVSSVTSSPSRQAAPFLWQLRSQQVISWLSRRTLRCTGVHALVLDFGKEYHDFNEQSFERLMSLTKASLQELHVSGNPCISCQEPLECLTMLRSLKTLNLAGLPQDFIETTLPCLTTLFNLQTLHFKPVNGALPSPVRVLGLPYNLRELRLCHLWISQLPGSMQQLQQLTSVAFEQCHLESQVIQSICSLPAIEQLTVVMCSLQHSSFSQLALPPVATLRRLSVVGCGLDTLHHSMATLASLVSLDLSNNFELGMAGSQFAGLPQEVSTLTNLTRLDLSGCGLTTLPQHLSSISGLVALHLQSNSLSAWATGALSFGSTLQELDVSDNRFNHLPKSILTLTALRSLTIGSNMTDSSTLQLLPTLLPHLQRLKVIGAAYSARVVRSLLQLNMMIALGTLQLNIEVA